MQSGVYVHKVTHAVMHRMSADAQGVLAVADMQAFLDSSAAPDISTSMRWSPRFGRSAIPVTPEP